MHVKYHWKVTIKSGVFENKIKIRKGLQQKQRQESKSYRGVKDTAKEKFFISNRLNQTIIIMIKV